MLRGKSDFETMGKPVYCRRRLSKNRRSLGIEKAHRDPPGSVTDNVIDDAFDGDKETASGLNKSARRACRKKYQEADVDSGITSSKVKEKRLSKEYRKLEKRHASVLEECQDLKGLLEQREAEYRRVCSRYESLAQVLRETEERTADLTNRNERLQAEEARLSEDVSLLKHVVYRLNGELERYQEKLRGRSVEGTTSIVPEKNVHGSEETSELRASWGHVNFHALAPLLNAYEENLREKRELVTLYDREMGDFSGRCKEVLAENELMHKEVEDLRSKCDRYASEIEGLARNSATLKKRNDLLTIELADRKREVDEIRWSYERKIESISRDKEALLKDRAASAAELSSLRGKYQVLSDELEKTKDKDGNSVPLVVHTRAVEECRKLFEELKYRYETEKRELASEIKRMEESEPDNVKQLSTLTAERNHLKALTKTLERNLKRAERKAEHLQTAFSSTRASRDSFKERFAKATAYCEELFVEYERTAAERTKLLALLRETEMENASIDRLGRDITDRVHGLKSQLEIVQRGAKQQVATVEKRMKLQEVRVRRMKREYRRKVRCLKSMVKQKDDTIGRLLKEQGSSAKSTGVEKPET